ncbi:nascent polypeptide-associated complex protein [Thermogymnomonas acidicola]|uniref:Nascent polypeptide-associated complex protein n=2 Tax=Thermogymnomonas acidicola TaxID=399579 RepID=A0AA37BRH5_9ARCH|nr:nascent polypeptide-associated complex protein [Thermogymnomonas acidicola]
MNSREIKRMMAQMGIKSTEMTDVKEVIFRGKEKDYVISDAQVIMIEAQGQKTFQVSGTIKEVKKDTAASKATEQAAPFSEDDIKLVMEQAHVTREKAIEALKAADGEPAQAIVNLTGS